MELSHLKYFYIVAREQGFTKASKVLRVQQPAISKMVRQLEESLGVVLLERQRRQVRLTKAGEEVFKRCESIFDSVEQIVSFSQNELKECSGPLKFGASDSVVSHLLPKMMKKFLAQHPKVRPVIFTGTSNSICNEIQEGRIEFGLFFTVPESGQFDVATVADVPFRFVVSSKLPKTSPSRNVFIGSREVDYPKIRSFPVMEMLRDQGMNPEVMIACNNLDAHRNMALEGLGSALLPAFMVDRDIERNRLEVLYPKKSFQYPLKRVVRRGKVLSRNAETFLQAFIESCKEA
ncbi:MAG: LysR family transcriptional regulator [Bdellovibrionota bacterium]